MGIFGAATAAGFVSGQVLGGVLTDVIGWRSIFVINLPVALICSALVPRMIAADAASVRRRMPDVPGALSITAAMALLVWAPTRGAEKGWGSGSFLIPLTGALVFVVVFLVLEGRQREPLVRPALLRSRWLAGTNATTAVTGALNGAVVLLCTLSLQRVHGYSPLRAGLSFVPMGVVGLLVGTRYAGRWITRSAAFAPARAQRGHRARRTHRARRPAHRAADRRRQSGPLQMVGENFSFSLIDDERPLAEHVHLAFPAQDDATVRAFHAAALAAGYEDHGGPGERAVYHPGYYGAFILDPDGHNVEAVNHNR